MAISQPTRPRTPACSRRPSAAADTDRWADEARNAAVTTRDSLLLDGLPDGANGWC